MARAKAKLGVTVIKTHGKVRLDRHIRSYILEYLDELHKAYYQAKRAAKTGEKLETKPQVRGEDYVSEMEQGAVSVHGYLRRLFIEENEATPEETPRNLMATRLARSIHLASSLYGPNNEGSIIGSKIVFSLSDETTKIWREAGMDIDANLRLLVQRTFNRYSAASQEGAELGYAVGIHHDTDHYHAHVMLMNTDTRGRALRLSNRLAVTLPDGSETRVDFLDLLIGTANSVLREMHKSLDTPTLRTGFMESLGNDFERWIELAATDRLTPDIPKANAEVWVATEKERLRTAPLNELLPILDQAFNKRASLFKQCQTLAQTTDGVAQLMQREQDVKAQLGSTYDVHLLNKQRERAARSDALGVMKDHAIELRIVNRLIKLGRIKSPQLLRDESINIRTLYNELTVKNPRLKKLIEDRLFILESNSLMGPQNGKLGMQQRLDAQLTAAKARKWRDLAQRQYAESRKAVQEKATHQRTLSRASTIKEENLITLLYLFSGAQSGEIPTFLQRYQRVRKTLQIAEPDLEPLTKKPATAQSQAEPSEPRRRGLKGLEFPLHA